MTSASVQHATMSSPSLSRASNGMPMARHRVMTTRQLPIEVLTSPDMRVPKTVYLKPSRVLHSLRSCICSSAAIEGGKT